MLCPHGQDPSINGCLSSDSQVKIKKSHHQHGDSQFRNFFDGDCPEWSCPVPKVRLEVINPLAKKQEVKGLILLTTKSGKIMWVYLKIVKDEHWESSQPKLKGESCNVISLALHDDTVTVTSLSSSEEEKFAFAAQLATSQLVGTRSGK